MKLQMIIVETGERWRKAFFRMVLEPKFADYGSIHSIGEVVVLPHSQQQQQQHQQPQQQQTHQYQQQQQDSGGSLHQHHHPHYAQHTLLNNTSAAASTTTAAFVVAASANGGIAAAAPPIAAPTTASTQQAQQQQQQQQQADSNIGSSNNNPSSPLPPLAPNAVNTTTTTATTTIMTQGDLYQRQPLLSTPAKGDKWGHGSHPTAAKEYYIDDDEEDEENVIEKTHDANGIIKINMPPPVREEPRFPQERWKTLIAVVIFFFSSLLVLVSLATVHERVPDRKTYGPLPDVFYDILRAHDWGLNVSEYLIIIAFNSTMVVIILHKHRFILARRLFLIMSLLYMYRALTMFVTVLPISSTTYYCSPKSNHTSTLDMAKRVVQMLSGMGLSINGKQTYCGDFIYSGHTLILVLSYLFIAEYTPKKLYLIHWFYWLIAILGIFMLELSRSHYTIDVIIAYYVTTTIFWMYHTLANNASLKQHSERNLLSRMWWFSFFLYFEGNVGGQVPRQWPDWPFPWPRRFQTKSRDS